MVEIINRLNQPLVFNLNDGSSVHMLSKQVIKLSLERFKSREIQIAIRNGDLIVLRIQEESKGE